MQSDDKPFFKISKENFNFDYYYGCNTAKIRNSYILEDKLKKMKKWEIPYIKFCSLLLKSVADNIMVSNAKPTTTAVLT